jgi:hypothetical protein
MRRDRHAAGVSIDLLKSSGAYHGHSFLLARDVMHDPMRAKERNNIALRTSRRCPLRRNARLVNMSDPVKYLRMRARGQMYGCVPGQRTDSRSARGSRPVV